MKTISTSPPVPEKPAEEKQVATAPVGSIPQIDRTPKEEVRDRPYSAEYFDVPDWGTLLLEPKLDVYGLAKKVAFIDGFISDQLLSNSMKVDKQSFAEILSDIEKNLGVDVKNTVNHRIERVYGFLNLLNSTKKKEELRKKKFAALLKKGA